VFACRQNHGLQGGYAWSTYHELSMQNSQELQGLEAVQEIA